MNNYLIIRAKLNTWPAKGIAICNGEIAAEQIVKALNHTATLTVAQASRDAHIHAFTFHYMHIDLILQATGFESLIDDCKELQACK